MICKKHVDLGPLYNVTRILAVTLETMTALLDRAVNRFRFGMSESVKK
jgi:hypothetical protein